MADADRLLGGYDPNAGHSAHAATRPKHIPVPSLLRALLSEHLDPGYAAAAAKRDHSASPQSGRARAFGWFWQALAATLVATVFAAAVAQAYCSGVAVHAAEECIQLHGGIGMTWEYPAHLYLKRAKSDQLALGTPYQHRARLAELVDLLNRRPDYGPLDDPARRASCLSGLGYPASTQVLGGRPVEINARPGIVLVLPADTPGNLAVFAVALNCSAADTGLLADTQIPRP